MTICVECQNHLDVKKNQGADVWYNHVCKASKLEEAIDPVTGKKQYVNFNDLGGKYYTDDAYEYCKSINHNGQCEKFAQKVKLWERK
jgi:hypothetical protein